MEARGVNRRTEFEITRSLSIRFNARVPLGDHSECWHWMGCLRQGYGAIKHQGCVLSAHVVAYKMAKGSIPTGHVIRHSCRNRACVNPSHLSTGTPAQNIEDARECGDMVYVRGEECCNAVLSDWLVRVIRSLRVVHGIGATLIARRIGVARHLVRDVLHGGHWKHIPTPTQEEAAKIIAAHEELSV